MKTLATLLWTTQTAKVGIAKYILFQTFWQLLIQASQNFCEVGESLRGRFESLYLSQVFHTWVETFLLLFLIVYHDD
jgi:hypothetical protein